jgi:hypothetical protein
LRFGVSDRSSERIFAARLGAALVAQIDVAEKNAHWEYQLQGRTVLEGNTTFGGISIGMVMSLGFDLSFRRGEDE